jgi:uncharacterized phage protein (TIGR02218 family)
MKTIGAALKTHFGETVTTIAACWHLTRLDGVEFFFTDHDEALVIDGDTYEADSGMLPSSLVQNRGLSVDNMEAVAFLESEKIVEQEILGGKFDGSTVDIFLVNYDDLSMGRLWLAKEWVLGQFEIRDNAFTVEIRGKAQHLQQNICEPYTPYCRADLGDARCGIDLDDSLGTYRDEGAVTSVTTQRISFIDTSLITSAADVDRYRFGLLTWYTPGSGDVFTGENGGYQMEVKSFDPGTGKFTLFQPMPYDIGVGDEFSVTFGCDKSKPTCKTRFDNILNFRGEPFIPGYDRALDVAIHGEVRDTRGIRPKVVKKEGEE